MSHIVSFDNLKHDVALVERVAPVKPKTILLGMLSSDNKVYVDTMISLQKALAYLAQMRTPDGGLLYQVGMQHIPCTNIFMGRNDLVKEALRVEADYVLMLDTDMTFPVDGIASLLRHDVDIVSGVAFKKGYPYAPAMGVLDKPEDGKFSAIRTIKSWTPGALLKVGMTGTAFLLVKTSVFEKLEYPWFYHAVSPNKKTLGSDVYFCAMAREAGYDIHVDTHVECGHIGSYEFGRDEYTQALGPLQEDGEVNDPSTEFELMGDDGQ